jgi:hypothetical protein
MMQIKWRGALLLLAGLLAGCQGLVLQPLALGEPANLDSARARWAQYGSPHYSMVIQQTCFCPPEFTQPVQMEVKDGAIIALQGMLQPLEKQDRAQRQMKTVERLFDFIEWAQRNQPHILVVRYHAQLGYPERVRYDGHARIADDEFEFVITELKVNP